MMDHPQRPSSAPMASDVFVAVAAQGGKGPDGCRKTTAMRDSAVCPVRLLVNASLKLVENQRSEIDGLRGLSVEICERISPSIFWWQTASGGKSLSRPQPPEAVAEGQSLQGIASRPSSATEIDIRRAIGTTAFQPTTPTLASSARQITKKR